jgi:hypothetical protein
MRLIGLLLFCQALLSAAAPSPVNFYARRDTPVGNPDFLGANDHLTSLTIADFNGDRKPDLAVLSAVTNSLFILLNNGDGHFEVSSPINVGPVPQAVVAGDFDGDGNQDLAVISAEGTGILLGNGNGTFQPLANIRNAFGNALAVGDFNGDGILDLVAGDNQFGTLLLLIGNGNGTFQAGVELPSAGNPVSLAVADLNNDGRPDLIVATGSGDKIVTLLNKGHGTFTVAGATTVPGATALATADFNNDGNVDVACQTLADGSATVVVLLGQGNGELDAPVTITSGGNAPTYAAVAAGDLSGDGNADLVAIFQPSDEGQETLVLLGQGNGSFDPQVGYAMNGPSDVGIADFNGDGHPDIVTTNDAGSVASVLFGTGNGTFQSAPETVLSKFTADTRSTGVAAADLTGGGLTDFVAGETTGAQVLMAAGDNTYTIGQFINVANTGIALADVNGDGKPDMILTTGTANTGNTYSVEVFLGNGDGTFPAPLSSNTTDAQSNPVVGDFNNDGKPDLALLVGGEIGVMLGNGAGGFAAPTQLTYVGPDPISVAVGDFNNDGKLDVAVSTYPLTNFGPAAIYVLLGNGDGTFQAPTTLPLPSPNAGPIALAVADLNADGNLDIVCANNNLTYISVYLGHGDGTFANPTKVPSGFAPDTLAIADLNGDGIPDIAFVAFGSGDVGIVVGNGDGTFEPATYFGASSPSTFASGTLAQGGLPGLLVLGSPLLPSTPPSYSVLRNISK